MSSEDSTRPFQAPGPQPTIFQVNVSRGGVPKRAIREAEVTYRGLVGDGHNDGRAHGGPDQALCLYGIEVLAQLRSEGHSVDPGATGENITTLGLHWRHVVPGTRMWLGETVLIEVTSYASPCWKNSRWFKDGNISRINQELHPGSSRVYARVLQPGTIKTGDSILVIDENAADRAWRAQPYTIRWPQDYREAVPNPPRNAGATLPALPGDGRRES